MRTTIITVPTLLALALCTLGCHPPTPPCEPGDADCRSIIAEPGPGLGDEQAQLQLADIHADYQLAAADGLSTDECQLLGQRYQALYERDKSIITARFNVGVIHEACGQVDLAGQIYAELAGLEHAPSLNNLGVLAWSAGDHDRAASLFGRAVAADSTHALEARNNLAMAERDRYTNSPVGAGLREFEQAQLQLQRILAVDSSNRAAYENLARLYYDRGRRDDKSYLVLANLVVTQGQRVLEANSVASADLHNLRGLLLIEDDDQVLALRAFQRAVEIEPDHVDANRNIAMVAIRFRDYATAERALESVLHAPVVAADVDAWIALGVAKRGLRKYADAERAYRRALELDSTDPRPWYNLGVLTQEHLSSTADDEEALIASYERAIDHYQSFIDAAGSGPRWRAPVSEARDRVAVVKDSIAAIELIKVNAGLYEDMLLLEIRQRAEQHERWRALETNAVSLQDLLEG
ncbi:tetratricopeptide repeat protein [Enhygromyxa salina]|uniref:Photosystem I assembly protein Ycf3 n=1 Tax=Enhygromyxa salina TaxID=215803 RepID=A0A2S9YK35_9BACT|nr:tetratricopeptide repeat protein [Enhygromyxa salina]PRQ05386.1 photosystem I assembly protein Ycf3 [Enhygromyxa salina]